MKRSGTLVQSPFVMRDHRLNQLFLRYRQKADVGALGKLFDASSSELLRVARHVAGDDAEAEDLVQATFLAAMEHSERFDESRPIMAWLVGMLTKEALSWRRQSARRPDAERVLEASDEREARERPELHATSEESQGLLSAALDRLPKHYRDVLERHLVRGQSPGEIAREQAAQPATVRVQLHRGLAQLRQLLPASMAGGLVLSLSPRGLAAVRVELVSHAAWLAPASGVALTTTTLGSLIMLQRIGLGTLGLLLLAFLAKLTLGSDHATPEVVTGGTTELVGGARAEVTPVAVAEAANRSDAASDELEAAAEERQLVPGRLRVSTVWADGTPAPGVAFQCTRFTPDASWQIACTDAAGLVVLEDLAPGQYLLYGDRGGHATAQVMEVRTGGEVSPELREQLTAEVTLQLQPGVDVRGRVLDANGHPVAGAALWITIGLTRASGTIVAHSAADGSFEVRQLTSDCFLGARAEGHAPSRPQHVQYWMERKDSPRVLELDLELRGPDALVSGIVLDPAGSPVEGARVRVGAQDSFDTFGPTGAEGPPPPLELVTDERGEFVCRGVEPGVVELACRAEGFAICARQVEIAAGERGQVELRLETGAWVRGQVTSESGVPLDRVTVSVYERQLSYPNARSSFDSPRCETDGTGHFELGPLSRGECVLRATTPDRKHSAESTVQVSAGTNYAWNPTLSGLPVIAGHALASNGSPLVDWHVAAEPESPFGPRSFRGGRTAADGSFELTLSTEGRCQIRLYAPEPTEFPDRMYFTSKAPSTWIDGVTTGTRDLRLILDPAQEPTALLTGELTSLLETPKFLATVYHPEFHEVAKLEFEAGTTRFELPGLPAGKLELKLEPVGHAPIWQRGIELEQGEQRDLGALRLEVGGDLRVTLARADGGVPEKLDIEFRDQHGVAWYVNVQGAVLERSNLPPGEYSLRVLAQDCGPYVGRISVLAMERTEVEVLLSSGGSIGFLLADEAGDAFKGDSTLSVSTADGTTVFHEKLEPNSSGVLSRWLFAPHGALTVIAQAEDGRRAELSLDFEPTSGADKPHILRLE